MLADWIAGHAARTTYTHRNIVCAGGLGELLGTRAWPIENVSECVNDLNFEVSVFWQVMAHNTLFPEFYHRCQLTPFSQEIYQACCDYQTMHGIGYTGEYTNYVDIAYRFYVMQRMGQQGRNGACSYATPTKRLRRGMNENVSAWLSSVDMLPEIHERMLRVEVACCDALEFIKQRDHANALFYIDPPYLVNTRVGQGGEYKLEWTEEQHRKLLWLLSEIKGKFILSGYNSPMYTEAAELFRWIKDTRIVDKPSSRSDVKPIAVEYLWMNF